MYFCLSTDSLPKISHMGCNVTDEKWKHVSRTSDEYILFIIRKGHMYLKEGEYCHALKAGDVLLLQPRTFHVGYLESSCVYYYIHFSDCTFSSFDCSHIESIEKILLANKRLFYKSNPYNYDLYEQAKLFIPKDIQLGNDSIMYEIDAKMSEVVQALDVQNSHYKLICSCKFIEILTLLSNFFVNHRFQDIAHNKSLCQNHKKTQEIIHYLHSHYSEKITGDSIATQMDMNFDYLNRTFKTHLGMTIFEYLSSIRINKAKELLMNGNMKSYEIATAVGFGDEYHFSKVFKKAVGISPKQYV